MHNADRRRRTRWVGMLSAQPAAPAPSPIRAPAPTAERHAYFFLSCDPTDYARVRPVIDLAERDGHRFWVEHRHPRSAEDIAAAIDDSTALVMFHSHNAATSLSVYRQVTRAFGAGIPIVTVSLDGAPLESSFDRMVAGQWIDARDPEWGRHLMHALQRLEAPRPSPVEIAPLAAPSAFARDVVVVTPRPVRLVAQGKRMTVTQSFINAFAAGVMALFGFAMLELTGGPPTKGEVQSVAAEVQDVAEDGLDAI
jgi:hypothetical protein